MVEYELRYYQKEQRYLVEIKDSSYFELDKQLRRIAREYDRISGTDSYKKPALEAKRMQLRLKRQSALKCFWISEEDIPAGTTARPLYKLPPRVEHLTGERYINMLTALKKEHR